MIYIALMMGLVSSLHCIGMCGPLALAVPVRTTHVGLKLWRYLIYHSGRILSYATLGLTAGIIGKGFSMIGWQQWLSILTGISMIAIVFFHYVPFKKSVAFSNYIKSLFARYWSGTGNMSLLVLGMLNGFLPCGVVYVALMGAMATGEYLNGSAFMIFFGLGTLPALLLLSFSVGIFQSWNKIWFQKISPVLALTVAVLLILRGLNLGIPYVSPVQEANHTIKCHACKAE